MIREDVLTQALDDRDHGVETADILARHASVRRELAPLLELDRQLQALPREISLSMTAKARLRAQLLAEARQPAAAPAPYSFTEWWGRLADEARALLHNPALRLMATRPAAAALAVVMGFGLLGGGTVSAAMDAAPGEGLYPVKTAWEQTRLALASNQHEKAETYLWIAASRVYELNKLAGDGRLEHAPQVLSDYEKSVAQAVRYSSERSRNELALRQRIDGVKSSFQELYDRSPQPLRDLAQSLATTAPERAAPPSGPSGQAHTQGTAVGAPTAAADAPAPQGAVAGQAAPAVPLPREKGGPEAEIDTPSKSAPLSTEPTVAEVEQAPAKGTTPAIAVPLPSKENTVVVAPEPGDVPQKDTPVDQGGSSFDPGARSADPPAAPDGPGTKPSTIQGAQFRR